MFPRRQVKRHNFSRSVGRGTDRGMGSRERLYESARIAEQAELYEDMAKTMKELVMLVCEEKGILAKDERNLLSVAYKNVVGARRSAYRAVAAQEQKQEGSTMEQAKVYKEKIADEVREYCDDIIVSCCTAKLLSLHSSRVYVFAYLNRKSLTNLLRLLKI